MNLAIIATHPIQYQVPWFQRLARVESIRLKVYYALVPNSEQQGVGFGTAFTWDLPLLEGYDWELLANHSSSPRLGSFFGLSTPGILSALRRDRPDAIIITGWNSLPLLQTLWASIRLRIPRMVRGESNSLKLRPLPARIAHRALLSLFDGFLAIGSANRDFYLLNGVRPERIFTSRYFVDNQRFAAEAEHVRGQRDRIRQEWHIPASHTCFLFAGKLVPKKRILDLLGALDIARREVPSMHLLVAGSGELLDDSRALTASLNLPVTFAGFLNQTEISRAYVAADCLVLPSDYGETWGLVVNEAMASGLPAIVSNSVGCGPDLVESGATGFLFPFGDVSALAGRLIEAASSPERLQRLGAQAKHRIQAYSVESAVQDTLRALEALLPASAGVSTSALKTVA